MAYRPPNIPRYQDLARFDEPQPPSPQPTPDTAPPEAASNLTGIDPSELAAATYGKIIPTWVLGIARIGGNLIVGPKFYFDEDNVKRVDFGVSFGYIANPEGTRALYEIALDNQVVWTSEGGATVDWLIFRPYYGTQTQTADPLEVEYDGAAACGYRGQMCIFFEAVPYEQFNNRCPFASAMWGDTSDGANPLDGITLGNALQRLAESPYIDMTPDEFGTEDCTQVIQAIGIAVDLDFVELLRTISKVYRTTSILQDDKLKLIDWGSLEISTVTITRDELQANDDGCLIVSRSPQQFIPRERGLTFINPDIDFQFETVTAKRPRVPVPVTSAVARDDIQVPLVIFKQSAIALITFAVYQDEVGRETVKGTILPSYGINLRPGHVIDVNDGYDTYTVLITETIRGPSLATNFVGEAIMKCAFIVPDESDPCNDEVLLLAHFDGVDGSTTGSVAKDHSTFNHTLTLGGGAQADTEFWVFGGSSAHFDGVNDVVSTPWNSEWASISQSNAAEFTFEARIRPKTIKDGVIICADSGAGGQFFNLQLTAAGQIRWRQSFSGITFSGHVELVTTGTALVIDTWYAVAVDKDNTGKIRVYINGVMRASSTPANSIIASTGTTVTIGRHGLTSTQFHGNIDEVRVTKCLRYGSDGGYTPRTTPFPNPSF